MSSDATGYVERPGQSDLDIYETLTNREGLVLQLAAEGSSNPQIAKRLFISARTAEAHRADLRQKSKAESKG